MNTKTLIKLSSWLGIHFVEEKYMKKRQALLDIIETFEQSSYPISFERKLALEENKTMTISINW